MPQADFKSVDEYITAQPEALRSVLEQVRNVIRKAVPRAEEALLALPSHGSRVGEISGRAGSLRSQQEYNSFPALRASSSEADRIAKFRASEIEK